MSNDKLRQMTAKQTPKDADPPTTAAGGTYSLVNTLVPSSDSSQVRNAIVQRLISGSRLRLLRNELHLSVDLLAQLLDIAPRTVNRIETTEQRLSVAEGDRAFRIARMADLAISLIGDRENALAWLAEANDFLGGKKPIEMLDTEIGTDLVAQSLHAIAYGGVA